jgi:hypothetical protein
MGDIGRIESPISRESPVEILMEKQKEHQQKLQLYYDLTGKKSSDIIMNVKNYKDA